MQTNLPLGYFTQKKERLRQKRIRPVSKFIRIFLKVSFHREEKE
jgi:hypothetical protein